MWSIRRGRRGCRRVSGCGIGMWWVWCLIGGSGVVGMSGCWCIRRWRLMRRRMSCGCRCCVVVGWWWRRLVRWMLLCVCGLTSGLFRVVAQEAPEAFAGLREVWTGGDVVPAAAVRRVLDACAGLVVVDGYGPTETTTFATCFRMAGVESVPDVVPIGRPIDNMRTYVLDAGLRSVPPGAPGGL